MARSESDKLPAGVTTAIEAFRENTRAVLSLSHLDRGLLDSIIQSLEERDDRLRRAGVQNWRMLAGPTLQNLKNIRKNDSLRPGFQALVDQSMVLLASYFASGISELFRAGIRVALDSGPSEHLRNLPLKLTVGRLAEAGGDIRDLLPELAGESSGISFQNTESIARTFADFFSIVVPRDQITNEVTAGLVFRHVMVHDGGLVNRKCVQQVKGAVPRTLRPEVLIGERLEFTSEEIELLANAMLKYTERLAKGLGGKAPRAGTPGCKVGERGDSTSTRVQDRPPRPQK